MRKTCKETHIAGLTPYGRKTCKETHIAGLTPYGRKTWLALISPMWYN